MHILKSEAIDKYTGRVLNINAIYNISNLKESLPILDIYTILTSYYSVILFELDVETTNKLYLVWLCPSEDGHIKCRGWSNIKETTLSYSGGLIDATYISSMCECLLEMTTIEAATMLLGELS